MAGHPMVTTLPPVGAHFQRQMRLFLEEICCEVCRFRHVEQDKVPPDAVHTSREVDLGQPGAFADIHVEPVGLPPYFVEIKYGYAADRMLTHLARKYSADSPLLRKACKLVLMVDTARFDDWERLQGRIREVVNPSLPVEIWDEARLLVLIRQCFGVDLAGISVESLRDLRGAIDDAKWRYAYDGKFLDSPLKASLLWHFGFWRLRHLYKDKGLSPDDVLRPGRYKEVVVLLADLSAFSSYVRDTRNDEVVRSALTTFYSNSRYAIMAAGGMMCQFVGDEVVALFGVPDVDEQYAERALGCARSLLEIGSSVSNKWQREIDRVQASGGVHVGMSVGDVEAVPLRPFCRTHIGVIGDTINMAARLMARASASEIIASNTFFQLLPEVDQGCFEEVDPIEGKNLGLIKAWKAKAPSSWSPRGA
jgi:class 3 adenylate cyclase